MIVVISLALAIRCCVGLVTVLCLTSIDMFLHDTPYLRSW